MAPVENKSIDQVQVSRGSDDEEKSPITDIDWTPEEEKKAKWKSVSVDQTRARSGHSAN
jgi:hypothetical protein